MWCTSKCEHVNGLMKSQQFLTTDCDVPMGCRSHVMWFSNGGKRGQKKTCTNIIQNLELGGINEDVCLKMRIYDHFTSEDVVFSV